MQSSSAERAGSGRWGRGFGALAVLLGASALADFGSAAVTWPLAGSDSTMTLTFLASGAWCLAAAGLAGAASLVLRSGLTRPAPRRGFAWGFASIGTSTLSAAPLVLAALLIGGGALLREDAAGRHLGLHDPRNGGWIWIGMALGVSFGQVYLSFAGTFSGLASIAHGIATRSPLGVLLGLLGAGLGAVLLVPQTWALCVNVMLSNVSFGWH